jgi:hypothetical protein
VTALDLFDTSQHAALIDAQQNLASDLPVGVAEDFATSLNYQTRFKAAEAYEVTRERVLGAYSDDVFAKTGQRPEALAFGQGRISADEFNATLQPIIDAHPDAGLKPLSSDDVDRMTLQSMAAARNEYAGMASREKTFGASLAGFAADAIGGALGLKGLLLPLGGAGELGILGRAAEFAAIGGGMEALDAAGSGAARERAVPGSSKEIPGEILGATLGGAVLGGAFGALGRWLKASDGPLLTTAREDVNAAASEAQLAASNVFPTAAGEAANRDAVTAAVAQVAKGEPVDVAAAFDPAHVAGFADEAAAKTPEALAASAERSLRPETFGEKPEFEKFPEPPSATDKAFDYWDQRLAEASPEERVALGATDTTSPEARAALAADPAVASASAHDLEHILQAKPDMDYVEQVTLPDGSTQLQSRKLSDVLKELDEQERAAGELEACVANLAQAAE